MNVLHTPLYADIVEFCTKRARDQPQENQQGREFTFKAATKKGLEIEYTQTRLPDGDYHERLLLRKGKYSQIHENKVRYSDGSMLIGDTRPHVSGYVFKQYKEPPRHYKINDRPDNQRVCDERLAHIFRPGLRRRILHDK